MATSPPRRGSGRERRCGAHRERLWRLHTPPCSLVTGLDRGHSNAYISSISASTEGIPMARGTHARTPNGMRRMPARMPIHMSIRVCIRMSAACPYTCPYTTSMRMSIRVSMHVFTNISHAPSKKKCPRGRSKRAPARHHACARYAAGDGRYGSKSHAVAEPPWLTSSVLAASWLTGGCA